MTSSKSTKRALATSALAILLCAAMLIGTTFAWFTDTASTGVNRIVSGNLDIELSYKNKDTEAFKKADANTPVFKEGALWEPGHVEYVVLKLSNAGSLALKYKLGINIAAETGSTNVSGNAFKLSDYIRFAVLNDDQSSLGRDALVAAAADSKLIKEGYTAENHLAKGESRTVTLVVWMPTTVGNEANHKTGVAAPAIDLGINVVATQDTVEHDSFGNTYDENADYTIQVNKDNIQDYLDGMHGSIDGMTLVLAAGNYDRIELGRATRYPGSNTQYRIGGFDTKPMTFEAFYAAKNVDGWSGVPYYIRSMNNVTFRAAEGAEVNVAGVYAVSGHRYQNAYDYVLGRDVQNNSYHVANRLTNITFDGITFTAKSDINTSIEQAIIDGFTFKDCTFKIEDINSIALRYYNENNNGNVRNLVVDRCQFIKCFQGVYTHHVYGVSVTNSSFDTTGHNAIAVQDHGDNPCNHGKVVITDNRFTNIGDRIIRFNNVGADTQITIKSNNATNSGDNAGQVIKATSLANGIKYDISGNNWGDGRTVANIEFADK